MPNYDGTRMTKRKLSSRTPFLNRLRMEAEIFARLREALCNLKLKTGERIEDFLVDGEKVKAIIRKRGIRFSWPA
jgi:hypothetical protein